MYQELNQYAQLLVNYCVSVKKGDKVLVDSTTLAEPLLREVYREILRAGGHPHVRMMMRGQETILMDEAQDHQLSYVSPLYEKAMREFECYIYVRAPYNLRDTQDVDPEKRKIFRNALKPIREQYFRRTGNGEMRRTLCQFPTLANAQEAGMALDYYQDFIFKACKLDQDDPIAAWKALGARQQVIVDKLNSTNTMRYVGPDTDITFSTQGRTWINSDGRTNMPSGEVYTSPVEDSVNGTIRFSYPAIYMGNEVEDVQLTVRDGQVVEWAAARGKDFLDTVFDLPGARRFGEAAIGTNYDINRHTNNILFDEKIGGTIHMAIGQSYAQAGGKNESSIHWDMISDMTQGGRIYADDELIYQDGKFLIEGV